MPLIPFIQREPSDSVQGRTSGTNNEFYSSLVFLKTKILDEDEIPAGSSDTVEDTRNTEGNFELPTVLMSISKSKNIVRTEVQGRVGTVKEYISDGDYQIRVSGSLTTDNLTVAPREEYKLLDRFLSLGQSLEVAGSFLVDIDILTVVIIDYDISEVVGTRNQYDFRITMESDDPIELVIQEGEASLSDEA